jgi:hypothetical protein
VTQTPYKVRDLAFQNPRLRNVGTFRTLALYISHASMIVGSKAITALTS